MPENLPTAGLYLNSSLRTSFNNGINQLIADIGRPLKLFFEPTASGCPNCFAGPDGSSNGIYDNTNPFPIGPLHRPFPNGGICPICRGTHNIITENSTTYTTLRKWNPQDFDATSYGITPTNVVKTLAQIVAKTDFKRSKKANLDGDVLVRIGDPVLHGFTPPNFVVAFWKKQD
jgi:hypothetical protein